jgi:hypothetical protein
VNTLSVDPALKARALENFRREVLLVGSFDDRRIASLNGVVLTNEQILEEMEKDPPTEEGLSLVKIWSRPKEEVDRIVREARLSR